jgi:hypothetical protein
MTSGEICLAGGPRSVGHVGPAACLNSLGEHGGGSRAGWVLQRAARKLGREKEEPPPPV